MRVTRDNEYHQKNARVYLDGVEQKFCLEADDQEGWVQRFVVKPDNPDEVQTVVRNGETEILEEKVWGEVRIEGV